MVESKLTIPCDHDAEMALIGAAILGKYDDISASGVNDEFFNSPKARGIWGILRELEKNGSPIDASTVLLQTKDHPTAKAQDVIEADSACPSAHNWPYYAGILDEKRKARLVQQVGLKLTDAASLDVPINQLISEAESTIFSLNTSVATKDETRKESFGRLIEILEDAHNGKQVGIPTGIRSLDKILGGLRGGQLITLAARPAVGKSALAGNIAENLVMNGTPVGFFSFEMTQDELNLRMLCSLSDTNLIGDVLNAGATEQDRLRVIAKAGGCVAELMKAPLHIVDDGSLNVAQIRSYARRMVRDHGIKLIIVDYMQLIQPAVDDRRAQRYVQVGNITSGLKQMAMELGLPVIGLAQVSRESDRESRRPRLSDLRESGSIEQDSDVVLFLYLDDPSLAEGPKMALKLFVAKNRAGRMGELDLIFIRNKLRFEDGMLPMHGEWLDSRREQAAK